MEEIDLCWRLKRMGYRITFVSASRVYHVGGGTLPKGNPKKTFLNFRNNLLLLYKNLPSRGKSRILFTRKVLDGISALRFLMQGALGDFKAVMKAHRAFGKLRPEYRLRVQKFRKELEDKNIQDHSDVIFPQIYPHSIVLDYFLKGKKQFEQIRHRF
jgi:GT2 family glycosyltransferase